MSEETHSPSVSADDVKKPVENGIPNGQETPPMKSGPSHSNENINAQCNHNNTPEEENGHQPNSSTPLAQKKAPSVPLLTINEDENDDEGVVKGKPFGHSRKGSSISQCSVGVGTSSCSLSRENSFISGNADTISLPLTLEQLKNDTSAQTTSDSALRLTADLSRDDLSDEQRHETLTKLLEEVVALKLEIVNLKEENDTLRRARSEMDDELHQLTENLFEEAYKMVDEAKGGKADAEKRLLDAAGQIEAMETKVSALNNLLHKPSSSSSSMSSPSTVHKHRKPSVKKIFKKIKKTKRISEHKEPEPLLKQGELMTEEFKSFMEWVEKGLPLSLTDSGDNSFLKAVYSLQINPCIRFKNEQLSERVMKAVTHNMIVIEPLAGTSVDSEAFKVPCALSDESAVPCSYRMKLGEGGMWYYISSFARNKIVSVCDFFVLVGYVQKGIVKKEPADLFWQMARLRGEMSLSILNLSVQESSS